MFRSSELPLAIALAVIFLAYPGEGIRFSPINEQGNDSLLAKVLLHSPAKQKLTARSLSSFVPTDAYPQDDDDPDAADTIYLVGHQTPLTGPDDSYYGLLVMMDVYGHQLRQGQWTSTAIWIAHDGDGSKSSLNSIHVGWQIYPALYGDSRTHFLYLLDHGSQKTGCFNTECSGFVPAASATIAPGAVIDPVSDARNVQNITLKVFKDKKSGDWWVHYGFNSLPKAVGYFPRSLFTSMQDKARNVAFGANAAHGQWRSSKQQQQQCCVLLLCEPG
ncbi:hypothetical protein ACP4OV_010068 [Aristida adscensionis]